MSLRDIIAELDPTAVLLEGLDDAIIGFTSRGDQLLVVYSRLKIVETLLKRDGGTREDVEEYVDFNIVDARIGERTPVVVEGEADAGSDDDAPPVHPPVKAVRPKRAHTHR